MGEDEDKGYTVEDRRYLHLSEEEKAKLREKAGPKRRPRRRRLKKPFRRLPKRRRLRPTKLPRNCRFPEITFSSFIFSLSSSAFVSLGAIPDPNTGKVEKNLPLVKQTIDLLGLLREKTRNNLTQEEETLFDHLLYDLRMSYVREVG